MTTPEEIARPSSSRNEPVAQSPAPLVHRLYADVWNERGALVRAAVGELVADGYRDHNPVPGQAPGAAGFAERVAEFHRALPDLRVFVDALLVDGTYVAVRWSAVGTHTGSLFGAAPTGQPVRATGIDIFRIVHGHIVEGWHAWYSPEALRPRAEPSHSLTSTGDKP